jgi:hypothetical protein
MLEVKLTRIQSTNDNLRTPSVEGVAQEIPRVDSRFLMFSKGLEFGTRLVCTTEVKEVVLIDSTELTDTYRFTTQNSEYELRVDSTVATKKEGDQDES